MALLNIRSLFNKSFIINDFILDNKLDCMFLTETWTSTDGAVTLNETTPPNYSYSYSSRSDKRGGGTATILSTSHYLKDIHFNQYSSFEYHAFLFSSLSILCICVYRPPKYSSYFITDFSDFISIAHSNYNKIIIVGDFNLHIDIQSDSLATEFLNLLNCMDFKQHVSQSTHNRGHILDLVVTYGLSIDITSVVDLGFSDHYCVSFNINGIMAQQLPEQMVRKRYLTAEVTSNFIELLSDTPQNVLPSSCDLIVNDLNSKLSLALDTVAPVKNH